VTAPPRVVSLVPSATETLYALGIEPVGITRFCTRAQRRKARGHENRTSRDRRAALTSSPNDEENASRRGRHRRGLLYSMSPDRWRGRARSARPQQVDTPVPAPFGGDEWDDWLVSMLTPRWWGARRVWRRPWMSLATDTANALLDLLGVGNVFADSLDRYPEVTLTEVAARAPSVILLPSEPYVFASRHVREVQAEVPGVPVRLVDGRDVFWWGIRTPDAALRLRAALASR
jgi:hypothetical protein